MDAKRYSVSWSPSHSLWLVYDRIAGQYVDHSVTHAGAELMAQRREKEARQWNCR